MTINFVELNKKALTKSRAATDFQYRWDRDDNRSQDQITVDTTLDIFKPIIEKFETNAAADQAELTRLRSIISEAIDFMKDWPDDPYGRKRNILKAILGEESSSS